MKHFQHKHVLTVRARSPQGFTLIETLFAMALTAMIGVAVSAMLVSVSYGTTTQSDLRRANIKEKVIAARMNDAIRSSKMVLDQGTDYLVLWMGDSRPNGLPDKSEIRRIDRDNATSELWSYRAPLTLLEANNTQYSFATDFDAVTTALMGTADFPGELWGSNVTAWAVTLDAGAQAASLVNYNITVSGNNVASAVVSTVSLRSR